jgi:hypothetical protein
VIGAPPSAFANCGQGTLSFASPSVDWLDGVVLSYRATINAGCPGNLSIVEDTGQSV